ncbi:Dehydrogenase, E1 component, partial [Gonapodya prolifera JEL478]
ISSDRLVAAYRSMLLLNAMDSVLYDAQRQGRFSFYMTTFGEEATMVAVAEAVKDQDVLFGQYREQGIFIHRGVPISTLLHSWVASACDNNKGRQMPQCIGSRAINFHTMKASLASQLPHAVGAAYALKLRRKQAAQNGMKVEEPAVSLVLFGDGAASEGDFHGAVNIAATLKSPTLFVCRNNGWAISTPLAEQYAGDGIASRGHGYGIPHIRVDATDFFAVLSAMRIARQVALEQETAVLVECLSVRLGHHSTSDDSTVYRSKDEIARQAKLFDPVSRLRRHLVSRGLLDPVEEAKMKESARQEVLHALEVAESVPKPPIDFLFEDVFDELNPRLKEGMADLKRLVDEFPDYYEKGRYAESAEEVERLRSEHGIVH